MVRVLNCADRLSFLTAFREMGYGLWTNAVACLPLKGLLLLSRLKLGVIHRHFGFKSRFLRPPVLLLKSVVLGLVPCKLRSFYRRDSRRVTS